MNEQCKKHTAAQWLGIDGGARPMGRDEWLRVLGALVLGLILFVAVIVVARLPLPDGVPDDAFGAWLPPILGGVAMGLASPAINRVVGLPARRGDGSQR